MMIDMAKMPRSVSRPGFPLRETGRRVYGSGGTLVLALAVLTLLVPGQVSAQVADTTAFIPDTTSQPSDTIRYTGPTGSRSPFGSLSLEGVSLDDPLIFGGQATISSDLYHSSGIDARRPGSAWQMALSPQLSVFQAVTLDVDVLVSSDQSHLRQNINHIGLKPTWNWGALHLGDFSRDYSAYILQGTRVRGGGLDLFTDQLRFSVQGGRLQRMTLSPDEGQVYRRNMIAASVGAGREMGSHFNISLIGARDDISREDNLIVQDTILIDTLHVDLRPRVDNRPQENLAFGLDGQLVLFERLLTLRGAGAVSLFTRDLMADSVEYRDGDLPGGTGWIADQYQSRISSSVDYAYEVEATVVLDGVRVRGGYEEVGPGYTSLGLPYLINDRRSYHLNTVTQFWDGRLGVQAQYRNMANNLVSQKLNTVDRNTANASLTARLTERVAATLTGLFMTVGNDASNDSTRLDTRSIAVTANTSLQHELLGRSAVSTVGYSVQQTRDGNILAVVPSIVSQNITGSVQLNITPTLSIAPSISGAVTNGTGLDREYDLLYGFRGNGRFLEGALRTMVNLNHTISHGRKITGAQLRASYPVWWGTDLIFQARHNRYSAFNNRPEFQESFVTTSISRSF